MRLIECDSWKTADISKEAGTCTEHRAQRKRHDKATSAAGDTFLEENVPFKGLKLKNDIFH